MKLFFLLLVQKFRMGDVKFTRLNAKEKQQCEFFFLNIFLTPWTPVPNFVGLIRLNIRDKISPQLRNFKIINISDILVKLKLVSIIFN